MSTIDGLQSAIAGSDNLGPSISFSTDHNNIGGDFLFFLVELTGFLGCFCCLGAGLKGYLF